MNLDQITLIWNFLLFHFLRDLLYYMLIILRLPNYKYLTSRDRFFFRIFVNRLFVVSLYELQRNKTLRKCIFGKVPLLRVRCFISLTRLTHRLVTERKVGTSSRCS